MSREVSFFDPLFSFDRIGRGEMNDLLVRWGHKMGPIRRPEYTPPIDFAFRKDGQPIVVIAADTLIRPTTGLDRSTGFELSRLCADPGTAKVSSLAMRMWRALAYPLIVDAWKTPWVISYQDAAQHTGNLYRYDGWVVRGYSVSGTDPRANDDTAKVRRKIIWGWNADAAAMAEARTSPITKPKWAESIAA